METAWPGVQDSSLTLCGCATLGHTCFENRTSGCITGIGLLALHRIMRPVLSSSVNCRFALGKELSGHTVCINPKCNVHALRFQTVFRSPISLWHGCHISFTATLAVSAPQFSNRTHDALHSCLTFQHADAIVFLRFSQCHG